jgi:hypothetical protein
MPWDTGSHAATGRRFLSRPDFIAALTNFAAIIEPKRLTHMFDSCRARAKAMPPILWVDWENHAGCPALMPESR